jgi:hypothetical protein
MGCGASSTAAAETEPGRQYEAEPNLTQGNLPPETVGAKGVSGEPAAPSGPEPTSAQQLTAEPPKQLGAAEAPSAEVPSVETAVGEPDVIAPRAEEPAAAAEATDHELDGLDFSDEAAEQFEQELAATKIAAVHRGKTERARVATLRAERAQAAAEAARQAAEEAEQALAATKIAAIQRGKQDRARVEELKEAQAAAEAEQAAAATKIAAIQRGKQDRARVTALRKAKEADDAQAEAEAQAAAETQAAATAQAAADAAAAAEAEVAAAEAAAAKAKAEAEAEAAAAAATAEAAAAEAAAAEAAAAVAAEAARAEESERAKPPAVAPGNVDWTLVFPLEDRPPSVVSLAELAPLSPETVDAATAGDCSKLTDQLQAAGIPLHAAKVNAEEQDRLKYLWPRPTRVVTAVDARESETGRTALHYAAIGGSKEAIELLVRAGADVNAVDDNGNTPLWANVNSRNGWSNNPAGFVGGGSICSKALAADALLTLGADPNRCGWTDNEDGTRKQTAPPLFLALLFESDNDQPEFEEWTAVALLLRHHVDLTVTDSTDTLPLHYAEKLAEGSILAPSVKLISQAELRQMDLTRLCAATQRLALARVTADLQARGLHTGPGAFWFDQIIRRLKYRPVNGGTDKGVDYIEIGAEYLALEKQPVTEEAPPRSKRLGELPERAVVLATDAEFTKMRVRVKVRVLSVPDGSSSRGAQPGTEGWIGIGLYNRREAKRLLLLADGSEDVAVNYGEWECGSTSKTAVRWAAQVVAKGKRANRSATAR